MQPTYPTPQSTGSASIFTVIMKILGGLVVVFFMFLPVAGCERTNEYNVSGIKLMEGIFKSGEVDTSSVLFFLSISCGMAIIFFRKALLSIIFSGSGILFFVSAYLYVKSKNGMDMVELKIGASLGIMAFTAVIILGIIKMITENKAPAAVALPPAPFNPPPPSNQQAQYQPQYKPPPPPISNVQPPIKRPKFCTKCGFKLPENFSGKFCTNCGYKII